MFMKHWYAVITVSKFFSVINTTIKWLILCEHELIDGHDFYLTYRLLSNVICGLLIVG